MKDNHVAARPLSNESKESETIGRDESGPKKLTLEKESTQV